MSDASDRLNLGALRLSEGFFLLRHPPVTHAPFGSDAAAAGSYRHVFTYEKSPPTIKDAAIEVIDSAKEKVFLASFLLGDMDLLNALYRAAARLRGGVYVISALDEGSLRRGLAETEADEDPDAAYLKAHNKRFEDMTERGIAVRGHDNFHAKFVVADDCFALVSSANLETRAFDTTGENGAVVTDPVETERLGRFFAPPVGLVRVRDAARQGALRAATVSDGFPLRRSGAYRGSWKQPCLDLPRRTPHPRHAA